MLVVRSEQGGGGAKADVGFPSLSRCAHLLTTDCLPRVRQAMTHNLILSYHLYRKMEVCRPHLATDQEMLQFHAAE